MFNNPTGLFSSLIYILFEIILLLELFLENINSYLGKFILSKFINKESFYIVFILILLFNFLPFILYGSFFIFFCPDYLLFLLFFNNYKAS